MSVWKTREIFWKHYASAIGEDVFMYWLKYADNNCWVSDKVWIFPNFDCFSNSLRLTGIFMWLNEKVIFMGFFNSSQLINDNNKYKSRINLAPSINPILSFQVFNSIRKKPTVVKMSKIVCIFLVAMQIYGNNCAPNQVRIHFFHSIDWIVAIHSK